MQPLHFGSATVFIEAPIVLNGSNIWIMKMWMEKENDEANKYSNFVLNGAFTNFIN